MNKKGQVPGRVALWVYRLLMLSIYMVVIYVMISTYLARSVQTNEIESVVLFSRILYGSSCITYADESKNHPGIIDINKINEASLNKCIELDGRAIQGFDIKLLGSNGTIIKEATINKDVYSQNPLCSIKNKKVSCSKNREYVLYYDGKNFLRGILNVDVVTINEQKR